MPMPKRRLTSVAIRLEGWIYLFDCGEGTQVPYKELHLGQRSLRVIAITHLHADHCLGLPGMLMLRAQMPDPEPLVLLGPPGLTSFVKHLREDLAMYINYEINIHEWQNTSDTLAYEDEHVRIFWQPVEHSVFCLGYRLEEHQRPGKFDSQKADVLGIPWGPLRGKLQRGETVITSTGTSIRPEEVIGPARRGRHAAYITDTTLAPSLESLLQGVDIAFLESMFLAEHASEAADKKHMTVEQAAQVAARAGVQRLALVHVSPRYDREDLRQMESEARRYFHGARVARDGEPFEVPLPD